MKKDKKELSDNKRINEMMRKDIVYFRTLRGFTAAHVSRLTGIPRQTYYRIEHGIVAPGNYYVLIMEKMGFNIIISETQNLGTITYKKPDYDE